MCHTHLCSPGEQKEQLLRSTTSQHPQAKGPSNSPQGKTPFYDMKKVLSCKRFQELMPSCPHPQLIVETCMATKSNIFQKVIYSLNLQQLCHINMNTEFGPDYFAFDAIPLRHTFCKTTLIIQQCSRIAIQKLVLSTAWPGIVGGLFGFHVRRLHNIWQCWR